MPPSVRIAAFFIWNTTKWEHRKESRQYNKWEHTIIIPKGIITTIQKP